MILNISPITQLIRETDFASASPAKARAIYGILSMIGFWVDDGDELLNELLLSQPGDFLHDECPIDGYEQSDVLWAALPLKERLLRLQAFYQQDIHQFSGGDDREAHRLMASAERTFEQCRKEAFDRCDTHIEEYLLFFHVLCLARPGYRHPDNVRLYLDYNRCFDALPIENYDLDSDLAWQYREVCWRRDMLHEQHFDLSLLPHLSFADKEACEAFRLQCYKWMLDEDPENDNSTQMQVQIWNFVSRAVHSIYAWVTSKYANGIELAPENEAVALQTILCGIHVEPCHLADMELIEEKTYDLLDRLSASKLKTHLLALMADYTNISELMDEAHADLATWEKSQLNEEDKYLIELQSI